MKVVMKCRGDFSHLVRLRYQLTCHPAVPFARLTERHTTGPCQQPVDTPGAQRQTKAQKHFDLS